MFVLYFYQGELGESLETPNAFQINNLDSSKKITFQDFLNEFPNKDIQNLHFRFQAEDKTLGYVWVDIKSHTQPLPIFQGFIRVKVLKLDHVISFKRATNLRLKLKTGANKGDNNLEFKPSMSTISSAPSSPAKPHMSEHSVPAPKYYEETDVHVPSARHTSNTQQNSSELNKEPTISTNSQPKEINLFEFEDNTTSNHTSSVLNDSSLNSIDDSKPSLSREELAARREANIADKVKGALEFKQGLDELKNKESEEFEAARMKHDQQLTQWAYNLKEKRNVRTLLSTMDTVLWPGNTWKKIGLGDLLEPKQVKLQYRKAMLVVHTDRCSSQSVEIRFVAKRIFEAINEAYQEFLKKESVD